MTASLGRRLAERADQDVNAIKAVLTELERSVKAQLAELRGQAPLIIASMSPEEREQFERDVQGLERGLSEIPAEIAQEQEAIRKRYGAPRPQLFPAAVTCLVRRVRVRVKMANC